MADSSQDAAKLSRWIPLENNPEVLNNWSKEAGLQTDKYEFQDVYGLDSELLGMLPRPVEAALLLFPIKQRYDERRKIEDALLESEGNPLANSNLIWIKQTISNACGTMGLLHALLNTKVAISPDSPLTKFAEQVRGNPDITLQTIQDSQELTASTVALDPHERSKLLETTPLFASIHAQAANTGQTAVPTNLDTDYHFTCFIQVEVEKDGVISKRMVELDGRRAGPVDRGASQDLIEDVATYIKDTIISDGSSVDLSLVALVPVLD